MARRLQVDWSQPVNPDAPLNRGLVSWWMAGENPYWGGPKFLDLCGKNHGTLTNGPTWGGAHRPGGWGTISKDGAGGEGVGTDKYVLAPVPAFATDAPVSAFCWIRPAAFTDFSGLIGHLRGGVFTGWTFYLHGDQTIGTFLASHRRTTATVAANAWSHVGFTFAAGDLAVYINGVSQLTAGSVTYTGSGVAGVAFPRFYSFEPGDPGIYNGDMDDVRIYTRDLSAADVAALYQASLTGYQQELNYYRRQYIFDVGAGGGATAFPHHYYQQMQAMAG